MRVTNNSVTESAIANLSALRESLDTAQMQVSSGLRFTRASEDPSAARGVMQNQSQMRAVDQYQRNIGRATSRAALEESALTQLGDLLTRARELAIGQATGTADTASRAAAGAEVNQLLAQAVNLANSKDGTEYLFGGTTSSVAPFLYDGSGPASTFTVQGSTGGVRAVEIGSGQRIAPTHDGTEVFGDSSSGVLKTISDLASALATNDVSKLQGTLGPLDSDQKHIQMMLGETGARANQLQLADANLTAFRTALLSSTSDLQDVDIEQAVTTLATKQTAYQAAMAASARVLNLSLTDYLR